MTRWNTKTWGSFVWGPARSYFRQVADQAVTHDDHIERAASHLRGLSDVAVGHSDSITRHVVFAPIRPGPIPALLARQLVARARRMLDDMPPYEADEPWVQLYVDACARELDRVEGAAKAIRHKMLPQNADDEYGTLKMWEAVLGMPVAPDGQTESQRQSAVLARFRARKVGSGARWVELLTQALRSENWTHQEGPDPYTIIITIPFVEGSWDAGQVNQIARAITPAHEVIDTVYAQGFILGISQLSYERF